jgi:hypothetical protein
MDREGLKSVLVVSDPPHLLRVRYCLFSAFRGSDVVYRVIAVGAILVESVAVVG